MLTVDEAQAAIEQWCAVLPPQRRRLAEALGCVLAEDVTSDIDLPPFDKALVDGYAVRSADLNGASDERSLTVVEEITAGQVPSLPLGVLQAAAIMTGAPLPSGADAVVMIEKTRRLGSTVVIDDPTVVPGKARLARGRELKAGDVVLRSGQVLSPPRLGMLASVGRSEVLAIPQPRVAIVPTGDELVEPDQVPGPGQIRNSSAAMLRGFVEAAGAEAETLPISPDDPERLGAALAYGLRADVLLVTGGVSAGKLDLVPQTLERLGVTRVFHKVRLKPGKPLWFGIGPGRPGAPGALVFGLPGNPVSGIVGYLLFVRPALLALAGRDSGASANTCAAPAPMPLSARFVHSGDRPSYHPVRIVSEDGHRSLDPLDYAGSADLKTVAEADGFAIFPAGDRTYEQGEIVGFLPLG
jgi:molybdopterin molybdotransferase